MVVVDDKGNYGKVTTIQAIDELQKYKIKRSRQGVIGDEMINFIFPKDKEGRKSLSGLYLKSSRAQEPSILLSLKR
jgi:hypothetical protein